MAEPQFEIIGQETDEAATDDLLSDIPDGDAEAVADAVVAEAPEATPEAATETAPEAAPDAGFEQPAEEAAAPVDQYAELAVPESIRVWKQQFEQAIAEKDAQAATETEKWKAAAKKELEDWYARNESEKRDREQSNKSAEDAFISKRDETTPGNEWERVAFLLDFNQKTTKNSKDVSRMRSILIQLKTAPLVR